MTGRIENGARLGLDIGGSSVKAAVLVPDGLVARLPAERSFPREDLRPSVLGAGLAAERSAGQDDLRLSGPARWRVAAEELIALPEGREPQDVLAAVASLAAALAERHGPFGSVGLALPGLFDEERGTAVLLPNLPAGWVGFPVRDHLTAALGYPVALINDARAFSLAESVLGAARGLSTVVCVVLGTGVGGGVVIDGRLLHGGRGSAGEIGHQTVDPDGPRCGCGNRGCVEAFISAAAVTRLGGRASVAEVYDSARRGDARALGAVRQTVRVLGIALANAYAMLAPDAFVIGGGVAGAGGLLLRPLEAQVRDRVHLVPPERIRVLPAALGRHAGAVGAALHAPAP